MAKTYVLQVRIAPVHKALFAQLAQKKRQSLSTWCLEHLLAGARLESESPGPPLCPDCLRKGAPLCTPCKIQHGVAA